ncbi:AraC family transcriptional regulator [Halopseudomonas maritima]|uniref:AraC family transcriptional regulator n=1 Tax=Halopseudomonas maritima TaxID=2918528 RepID=UPI001EECE427|nr:AraC family transcriptional regulator [Halopseudomonas maritima]UJJ31329.1 AraC family transcriptional regulator [Halopseudomonas maritima]
MTDDRFEVFDSLRQHNARLLNHAQLGNGTGLAAWYNEQDLIALENADHHTLSLYTADGYQSYFRAADGWHNGGGPDRLCLLPQQYSSTWDIRGPLSFVHLYFTDQHLRQLAEQTWDRSPLNLSVNERLFADDPQIALLYRHFLLQANWHDNSDQLILSSASNLLLSHVLRHYTQVNWQVPGVTGGLAPHQRRRVFDYIEAHLDQPLPLAELAMQCQLSEYHFARMFKRSVGLAPHQYVMNRRLALACELLRNSQISLLEIALRCGFSSASHFSNRFRQAMGVPPSGYRSRVS